MSKVKGFDSGKTANKLEEQLDSVGLRMPPYWSPKYLRNVEKLSKPLYKVKEERDVWMKVRDGTRLCVDIFRPDIDGRFPALVAESGYGKSLQSMRIPSLPTKSLFFNHDIEAGKIDFFVSRGYAFIIPDPRGIGKSEGEWYGLQSKWEQEDCYDTIEWIAQQPWCNGNIGMVGFSYFGIIQRLVAALQPPHLKAIFPAGAYGDSYEKTYEGGIISTFYYFLEVAENNPKLYSAKLYSKEELERKFKERLNDPDIKYNPYLYALLTSPGVKTTFVDLLLHPTDGPFWWERSAYKKLDKIKIPTYEAGFWANHYQTEGNTNCFANQSSDVPKKMTMFTTHNLIRLPGPAEWSAEILRWYDHWLKGVDTGIMDEPPIKLYVMGINRFRYEKEWPLERTRWTKYYLQRFGELSTAPEEEEDVPPDAFIHYSPLSSNKIQSLTYSTSPLKVPMELTGPSALYLYASVDQEDANFIIHLRDVSPTEEKSELEYGLLKASHREVDESRSKPWRPYHNHMKPEPVKPGQIYDYAIAIMPFSKVIMAGHRIELEIASTDPLPQISHHKLYSMGHIPSGKLTYYKIYQDAKHPSHLLLPIIPETPEDSYVN